MLAVRAGAWADAFDDLRLKWRDMLTQGTNATRSNPLYSNWIVQVENTGQSYLNSLNTSANRTYLWSSYTNLAMDSGDVSGTFMRLRAMALAYSVRGSGLEGNTTVFSHVTNGLDWMYARYYNPTGVVYDNWFDFEIAIPLYLNDTVVLLYSNLPPARISNYMSAIERFTPSPRFSSISTNVTGANKAWKSLAVALRGAIVRDSAKLELARDALSDVFPNVTNGDGMYADGSYIYHNYYPYNGGYGVDLLTTLGPMMQWLRGSSWEVTDPAHTNVFRWIHDAYEPFLFRGSIMQMVDGRYHTRSGDDHEQGHDLLAAILRVAQFAPAADAAAYKSFVKGMIQMDRARNFFAFEAAPFTVWADGILSDTNIPALMGRTEHRQFPGMDRVVHRTPEWAFGLAMSSSRVANYESTRGENLRGWYTAEGMTYLYNNDLTHYSDNYWSTIDPYRMPGTTVDVVTRTNRSGDGYRSPNNQVGGASIQGLYGVAAMHLNAYGSTLSARKSWFMFDDEIVCLGTGISGTDPGRAVETIVENRRLGVYGDNAFTVNGEAKPPHPGWSETLTDITWAHLAGSTPGADIGYFFPPATTVKASREARSGALYDINTTYGSKTPSTRNYLTLWLEHGTNPTSATYSYVLLPNKSAEAVAAYAANPDITVLTNTTRFQAVRENRLGITAVSFWRDGSNFVGGVSSDVKSSVIFRNQGGILEVGVSDPMQTNNYGANIEFSVPVLSALAVDPGVTVLQTSPKLRLFVNTSNTFGGTLKARFLVSSNGVSPTVQLSPSGDTALDAPATVTLAATAQDTDGTIARVDFYQETNRIAQVFAAPYTATVTNLGTGSYSFTCVAVDNSGLTATSALVNVSVTTPEPAGRGTGLVGEYFADQAEFINFKLLRTDTNINFTFTSRPVSGDHFSIRWTGMLQAQHSGLHQFHTVSDEGARLWIDGRLLIDNWSAHSETENTGSMTLMAGRYYPITLEYYDKNLPGVARLSWTEPGGVKRLIPQSQLYPADQGLRATYYYGTTVADKAFTRIDDTVDFAWGTNSPDPTVLSLPFSARWTGKVKANDAGQYKFYTLSDDGVRLWVNGQNIINNWGAHSLTEDDATINLNNEDQYYDIILEYFNASGPGTMVLKWKPPGETKQVIPLGNLTPHQYNKPPALDFLTNRMASYNTPLAFSASASDPEAPDSALRFSLDSGAPAGATIHGTNGTFNWTPTSQNLPGIYNITLRVTDAGLPSMTDAQTFQVTLLSPGCDGYYGDVTWDGQLAHQNTVDILDWVKIGLFSAALDTPTNICQLFRAKCAPATTADGKVTIIDWVYAGRLAAQLESLQPLNPGLAPVPAKSLARGAGEAKSAFTSRVLSIASTTMERERIQCLPVLLNAQGDENALSFSLQFDSKALEYISSQRGSGAVSSDGSHAAWQANTNNVLDGKLAFSLALPPAATLRAGTQEVATVCFRARPGSSVGISQLGLANAPVPLLAARADATSLPLASADATMVLTSGESSALDSLTVLPNGSVKLRLLAPPGVWELQASGDLHQWNKVSELENVTGLLEFIEPNPSPGQSRFYRAVKR